jgi:hypothetical protein
MAKKGAENNGNECTASFTSKAWLQATVKQQLRMKCKPPMLGFPLHLKHMRWKDTRALFRTFCNRTPNDLRMGDDRKTGEVRRSANS